MSVVFPARKRLKSVQLLKKARVAASFRNTGSEILSHTLSLPRDGRKN
jgi:hypothetical protein